MIIDTHAHIDQLEDLPGALTRAHEAGVSDIVAMSVDLDSMKKLFLLLVATVAPALGQANRGELQLDVYKRQLHG